MLELGPCQVLYGAAGAEVDLGKTHGGVTVKIKDDTKDLNSDQYGSAAEDSIITGTNVEVDIAFAEIGFDLLAQVLNQDMIGAASGVVIENNVGTSLKSSGKSLVLIKYVNGAPSTDDKDKVVFPCACPIGDIELVYDADTQRALKSTFKCFPTSVTANWGAGTTSAKTVFCYFGDETATA